MNEQVEKPINAGKPWTEDEIFLIALLLGIMQNF